MSTVDSPAVLPLETFRNGTPYPFCPGCGHSTILDRLDQALVALGRDPETVVIVSDIGCSGLSDQYFATSAFHGLHGRSITYATGIKLARPELDVIVVMGDGGTGIGGAHVLNAARRNIGITVLVFNNFNYGMTGGQHSATTPPDAITSTTPGGNFERPLDLCATVAANGAGYVFRGTSFDDDLAVRIADGIRTPGFALLDIWELCTAHFVPSNKASKRTLAELREGLGFASGVIQRLDRPEYGAAYRAAAGTRALAGSSALAPQGLAPRFAAGLDRRFELVVAGAAGGKVRSAARTLAQAAVLSGLWAAQRNDYPVTVKTGHSLSHLVLSPEPIEHAGSSGRPDAVLVLAAEGARKVAGLLPLLDGSSRLFVLPPFAGLDSPAAEIVLDPDRASAKVAKTELALFALAAVVAHLDRDARSGASGDEELGALFPAEALEEALRLSGGQFLDKRLAAVRSGLDLVRRSRPVRSGRSA